MHRRKHQQLLGRWLNFSATKPGQPDGAGEDSIISEPSTAMEPIVLNQSVSMPASNSCAEGDGGGRATSHFGTTPNASGGTSNNKDYHDHSNSCGPADPTEDLWEHPLNMTLSNMSTDSSVGAPDTEQHHSPRRPRRTFSLLSPRKANKSSVSTSSCASKSLASLEPPVTSETKERHRHIANAEVAAGSDRIDGSSQHENVRLSSSASPSRCGSRSVTMEGLSGRNTPSSGVHDRRAIDSLPPPLMIHDIVLDEGLLRDDASIDTKNSDGPSKRSRSRGDTGAYENNMNESKARLSLGSALRGKTPPRQHNQAAELHQSFAVDDLMIEIDDNDDGPDVEVYSKKKDTTRTAGKQSGVEGSGYHHSFESSGGEIDEFVITVSGSSSHAPSNSRGYLNSSNVDARLVSPEQKQPTPSWLNHASFSSASPIRNPRRSFARDDVRSGHQSTSVLEEFLPLDLMVMIPSSADPHNPRNSDHRRVVQGGEGGVMGRANASAYELRYNQELPRGRGVTDGNNGVGIDHGSGKHHYECAGDLRDDSSDSGDMRERRVTTVPRPDSMSANVNRSSSNSHGSVSSMNFDELYGEECYSDRQHDQCPVDPMTQRTASLEEVKSRIGKTSSASRSVSPDEGVAEQEREMIRLAIQQSLHDLQSHDLQSVGSSACGADHNHASPKFENSRNSSMDCRNSLMDNNHNSRASMFSVSTVYVRDSTAAPHATPNTESCNIVSPLRRGTIIGPEDVSTSEDQEREMIELALELSLQDEKASQASLSSHAESVSTTHTDHLADYAETDSTHSRNSLRHNMQRQRQPPPLPPPPPPPHLTQNRHSQSDLEAAARNGPRASPSLVVPRFSQEHSLLYDLEDYEDDDNDEALFSPAGAPGPTTLEQRQSWGGNVCPPRPGAALRNPAVSLQLQPQHGNFHPPPLHDQPGYHQSSSFERPMYDWERKLTNGHSNGAANDYNIAEDDLARKKFLNEQRGYPGSESDRMRGSQPTAESWSRTRPMMTHQHQTQEAAWSQKMDQQQNGRIPQPRSKEHEHQRGFPYSSSAAESEESWLRHPSSTRREFQRAETEEERLARVEKEMLELAMQRSMQES